MKSTTPKTRPKRPPEVYNADEIEMILTGCGQSLTGTRNRAMIALGLYSGLRISEVLDLYPKDVDIKSGFITVLHGKGDKARIVPLDAQSISYLHNWIIQRKGLGLNGRQKLFCTISQPNIGHPIDLRYMRLYLKRLRDKINLDKDLRFHCLRHTFAHESVRDNINPVHIQSALGHANLQTTTNYLKKISPTEMIEAYRNRKS